MADISYSDNPETVNTVTFHYNKSLKTLYFLLFVPFVAVTLQIVGDKAWQWFNALLPMENFGGFDC